MENANISMDTALLSDVDDSADELGITRSEWFREAARQKLQSEASE